VEAVADRVGMGTSTNLRHHFREHLRVTPRQYRRTFRGTG